MTKPRLGDKILLVDDMVDSGHTLQAVHAELPRRFAHMTELRTAVLWWKACSVFKPDYHVDYLPDNPWIHQPFEVYDNLRPDQLKARLGMGGVALRSATHSATFAGHWSPNRNASTTRRRPEVTWSASWNSDDENTVRCRLPDDGVDRRTRGNAALRLELLKVRFIDIAKRR